MLVGERQFESFSKLKFSGSLGAFCLNEPKYGFPVWKILIIELEPELSTSQRLCALCILWKTFLAFGDIVALSANTL